MDDKKKSREGDYIDGPWLRFQRGLPRKIGDFSKKFDGKWEKP